jgi:hypothetical protein
MQTLILGNRDDIEDMAGGGGAVLTAVLKLIDRYDLYGQVAYPKHHKQTDVPHIYRLAAKTKVESLKNPIICLCIPGFICMNLTCLIRLFAGSIHQPSSCGAVRPHNHRGKLHNFFARSMQPVHHLEVLI